MSDKEKKQNKVFLRTFGCQMNVRDSEVIAGLLKKAGYQITDNEAEADVVIFNTCSVRQHAEDRVWSAVGACAKLSKKPLIGLVGCIAQNYQERAFDRAQALDFVVGPADIAKIPGIIKDLLKTRGQSPKSGDSPHKLLQRKIWETNSLIRPEEIYHTGFYQDKDHAFVVISEGCSNFCSYCVVPYTRGALRHRNYKDILKEVEEAAKNGITKLMLLGQNVNAYDSPEAHPGSQVDFIGLLKKINDIQGIKEIDFFTSHPKDTKIELFKVIADCQKIKKHLHLPLQSGSDKILRAMNRGYTRKYYLDLVDNYRKIVKEGTLSTDIIVGFPGETRKDFQDTYNLLKKLKFNSAYIFKYSPRPNTAAQKLADDVSREEKERRHRLILDLQREISRKKNG